jgi:hypothetical protein
MNNLKNVFATAALIAAVNALQLDVDQYPNILAEDFDGVEAGSVSSGSSSSIACAQGAESACYAKGRNFRFIENTCECICKDWFKLYRQSQTAADNACATKMGSSNYVYNKYTCACEPKPVTCKAWADAG